MNDQPKPNLHELADDLGWLETHAQTRPGTAGFAVPLRFAAAHVRNLIAPAIAGNPPEPLHVASSAARAPARARSPTCSAAHGRRGESASRLHAAPVAFTLRRAAKGLDRLSRLARPTAAVTTSPSPSSRDEDVYQIRTIASAAEPTLLDRFVVWDCPDMTTWAATGYAPRLLEVAALADVIVYVASDERYNDAVPTQYLNLFLASGKPVVVVLTKVAAENVTALCDHFRSEVLAAMPRGRVAVMAIPFLTPSERGDLRTKATQYRIPLINQIAILGDPLRLSASETSVRSRTTFETLRINCSRLLATTCKLSTIGCNLFARAKPSLWIAISVSTSRGTVSPLRRSAGQNDRDARTARRGQARQQRALGCPHAVPNAQSVPWPRCSPRPIRCHS